MLCKPVHLYTADTNLSPAWPLFCLVNATSTGGFTDDGPKRLIEVGYPHLKIKATSFSGPNWMTCGIVVETGAHTVLGPIVLLYTWAVQQSLYTCTGEPGHQRRQASKLCICGRLNIIIHHSSISIYNSRSFIAVFPHPPLLDAKKL